MRNKGHPGVDGVKVHGRRVNNGIPKAEDSKDVLKGGERFEWKRKGEKPCSKYMYVLRGFEPLVGSAAAVSPESGRHRGKEVVGPWQRQLGRPAAG
jgi:hypothetical protein